MSDALVYSGRLNALNGEPGGGKTWVALHACAEAIRDGHQVIYIDLEDHPGSIVGRLKALGATREDLLERFHYIRPSSPLMPESLECVERRIAEHNVALIVIDSIGELMALQGVSPNDDDAVARFYRAVPRYLADLGPAVLVLDHVPKSNEHAPLYAIGSQRKKAAIDGAAYMVETIKAFAADTPGKIVLRTAKDRNGNFVVGTVAAEISVDPEANGDRLTIDVRAPEMAADGSHQRQTVNMGRVVDYLTNETSDASAGFRELERGTKIHERNLKIVLADLVAEGVLNHYPGGRGKPDRYCKVRDFDPMQPLPNTGSDCEF